MSLSQDFEKKVEIGLRLNSKLSEFAKTLSREEQRGLGALVRLAEFAIENGGIALFGLENREILRKVRRKLIELNCDSPSSPERALLTTPAVAVTLADIDALFK